MAFLWLFSAVYRKFDLKLWYRNWFYTDTSLRSAVTSLLVLPESQRCTLPAKVMEFSGCSKVCRASRRQSVMWVRNQNFEHSKMWLHCAMSSNLAPCMRDFTWAISTLHIFNLGWKGWAASVLALWSAWDICDSLTRCLIGEIGSWVLHFIIVESGAIYKGAICNLWVRVPGEVGTSSAWPCCWATGTLDGCKLRRLVLNAYYQTPAYCFAHQNTYLSRCNSLTMDA